VFLSIVIGILHIPYQWCCCGCCCCCCCCWWWWWWQWWLWCVATELQAEGVSCCAGRSAFVSRSQWQQKTGARKMCH